MRIFSFVIANETAHVTINGLLERNRMFQKPVVIKFGMKNKDDYP